MKTESGQQSIKILRRIGSLSDQSDKCRKVHFDVVISNVSFGVFLKNLGHEEYL